MHGYRHTYTASPVSPMNLSDRIQEIFQDSIAAKNTAAEVIPEHIAIAAERIVRCLMAEGKILARQSGCRTRLLFNLGYDWSTIRWHEGGCLRSEALGAPPKGWKRRGPFNQGLVCVRKIKTSTAPLSGVHHG